MGPNQQPAAPDNFQIPRGSSPPQDQPGDNQQPQAGVPVIPVQPPPEPPQAQREALKESVLIPKNPMAIILRIMGLLTLLDLAFLVVMGAMAFVNLDAGLIFLIFALFLVVKIGALGFLVFTALLPWANSGYYLSETHLVLKRLNKDITTDELTHELRNIEGVTVHQGIVARMFDYGDIILRMSTDKPKRLIIRDIKDPTHYKSVFDKYVSVNLK